MQLLPRPLRLRASFLARTFVAGGLLLVAGAAAVIAGTVSFSVTSDSVPFQLIGGAVAIGLGLWLLARGRAALYICRHGEESVVELAEISSMRDRKRPNQLNMEQRSYLFRLKLGESGVDVSLNAAQSNQRPLFLDEAHTRALVLVAQTPSGKWQHLFVRADLSPLALSIDQERALRDRILERRDMAKLVRDIHTC
jgi:hypothetical protein